MMPPAVAILYEVARAHGISRQELCGDKKTARLFAARVQVAQRLHRERGLTPGQIGRFLGGRDCSSIQRMVHAEQRERNLAHQRAKKVGWRKRAEAAAS
jgi:chromosomal replication initiation ATPase DnaA